MANRLQHALSPYLQQHRDNPVDWWEWGDDAFADAARRDVPVLLSVGYAACHWCHVMAHESFEDATTAREMNEGFVCVKVDREERPDVDAVYMDATQALTGQGGWPMTVFLTPDGRPFYAGTYFPPQPLHGRPSFRQVLAAVGEAWRDRRDEAVRAAGSIAEALAGRNLPQGSPPPDRDDLSRAVRALAAQEDREHGGFGGAPKFPPSAALGWLLRHGATDAETASQATGLAARTLEAMARSGTYDQLAGGFARYAVDAGWVVPHFEKMLYDNAQLARVYLHWWRLTGSATGRRIALETCDWMVAGLGTPEGGFASALDADTEGVEGSTYVWTPEQLVEVLGEDDGRWAADLLGVVPGGTFEHGTSTLRLLRDPWSDGEADGDGDRWEALRARLLAARAGRPAARSRRQGGAGLERAGGGRTGRDRCAARPSRPGRGGAALRRPAGRGAPRRPRSLAPGLPRRHLRLRRCGARGPRRPRGRALRPGRRHGRDLLGHGRSRRPRPGARRVRRRRGPPPRHLAGRGRSPARPGRTSGRPDRQRLPERDVRSRRCARDGSGAHGRDPLARSGRAGRGRRRCRREGGAALRWLGTRGGRGAARRPARGGRRGGAGRPRGRRAARGGARLPVTGTRGRAGRAGADDGLPLLEHRPLVDGVAAAYVCRGFVCERPTTDAAELARSLGATQPSATEVPEE